MGEKRYTMDDKFDTGMMLVVEKAKEWGLKRRIVCELCAEGRIPGAKKTGRFWLIPKDAKKPPRKKKTFACKKMGYVTVAEKAKEWGMKHVAVKQLAIDGKIPGAVPQSSRLWLIPKLAQKPEIDKVYTLHSMYDTVSEKAKEWDVTVNTVAKWVRQGIIPDALESMNRYFIPKSAKMPSKKERKKSKT